MKKHQHTSKNSALTLRREHIRVLTPTDLRAAAGGVKDKHEPTSTVVCGLITDCEKACH